MASGSPPRPGRASFAPTRAGFPPSNAQSKYRTNRAVIFTLYYQFTLKFVFTNHLRTFVALGTVSTLDTDGHADLGAPGLTPSIIFTFENSLVDTPAAESPADRMSTRPSGSIRVRLDQVRPGQISAWPVRPQAPFGRRRKQCLTSFPSTASRGHTDGSHLSPRRIQPVRARLRPEAARPSRRTDPLPHRGRPLRRRPDRPRTPWQARVVPDLRQRTTEGATVAASNDTLFLLFSQTKVLTSAAVWTLVEEGKLSFMDRVADHLPEFAARGKGDITIEQVMTHQGGFPNGDVTQATWTDHGKMRAAGLLTSRWNGPRAPACNTTAAPPISCRRW